MNIGMKKVTVLATLIVTLAAGQLRAQEALSPAGKKAKEKADLIYSLIRATRGKYTQLVVSKAKKDGSGASLDYKTKQGFVPLPAVIAREIAGLVEYNLRQEGDMISSVRLRSLYNINENQGLQSGFERDGWKNLLAQQQAHLAEDDDLSTIKWEPYVSESNIGDDPVLLYMGADPASSRSCVGCHNSLEQDQAIQTMRQRAQVEVGHEFVKHELMGALSITLPLDG